MRKEIMVYGLFCCCLFFTAGCSGDKSLVNSDGELQQGPLVTAQVEYEKKASITDLEMKTFFEKYLRIDEEAMLILNQKPQKINEEYWAAYKSYHSKTNEMLGQYLSEKTKKKLEEQYIHDDFQYFRFVELNDYMVIGI